MSGDYESWDCTPKPTPRWTPEEVARVVEKQERRRGFRKLLGWTLVMVAVCCFAYWAFR